MQDQRPNNLPYLLVISPYSPKLIGYLFQRIAASRSDEPLRSGPRSKIANQVIEIPLRRHFEFRRIDLVKWEGEIGEVLNELAFRRPESPDYLIVV